jgi:signal transduction histidine kinase
MEQTEVTLFFLIVTIIIFVFIVGGILFVWQYRRRKLNHEAEKATIERQHKLNLLHTQLTSQQQTMQFIGSEIHDSITQKLTLASIYSQKLEFENLHPVVTERLGKISAIINDSLIELRDISRTLTDSRFQNISLPELLQTECARVSDSGACKVVLHANWQREMSVTVKSFLLRVIQEFIQNSLKHAAASQIRIYLTDQQNGLSVDISDNGKGFVISDNASGGIGLQNMKRRVQLIGGTYHLQSAPGEGTSLNIFIDNQHLLSE